MWLQEMGVQWATRTLKWHGHFFLYLFFPHETCSSCPVTCSRLTEFIWIKIFYWSSHFFFFFFNKQNSWKPSPDCFFLAATSGSHATIWWCLLANVLVILSATGLKCQVLTEEPQERTQAFRLGNMFNLQKGQYREGGISPGCSDCAEGSRAAGKTGWATGESKWLGFLWRRAD